MAHTPPAVPPHDWIAVVENDVKRDREHPSWAAYVQSQSFAYSGNTNSIPGMKVHPSRMPKRPVTLICYCCGEKVSTVLHHNSCNATNWIITILTLGLFSFVFMPGCCDGKTNHTMHTCPKCGAYMGDSGYL
ncbi:hypothetical protein FVE85_6475 [Porphyridium purpureum]|uniref:LITAF domain-containing protein n=1 Tax=Porphyridium purpureum TaxID=35688 RepID=A0A5J4Z6S1_PORPP|nr:hypothetical protein FVE85_6475 [Porphyridium purpureum]|eukprot:POR7853..scf295_1